MFGINPIRQKNVTDVGRHGGILFQVHPIGPAKGLERFVKIRVAKLAGAVGKAPLEKGIGLVLVQALDKTLNQLGSFGFDPRKIQ